MVHLGPELDDLVGGVTGFVELVREIGVGR